MKLPDIFKSKTGLVTALVWLCIAAYTQWGCQGQWGNSINHQCYQMLGETGYYMANDYLLRPGLVVAFLLSIPLAPIFGDALNPERYGVEQLYLYATFAISVIGLYFLGYLFERVFKKVYKLTTN